MADFGKVFLGAVVWLVASVSAMSQTLPSGVIDAPPTVIGDNAIMGAATTLNVRAGGSVGKKLNVGLPDGTSTNVVLNVEGGRVGFNAVSSLDFAFAANAGSVVHISGGEVGINAIANAGSEVYISGGTIGKGFKAREGSLVEISGGAIVSTFNAQSGSVVDISGGVVGSATSSFEPAFYAWGGSLVTVAGGQFDRNFSAMPLSEVSITGGNFGTEFRATNQSIVHISGGRFGQLFQAMPDSQVTLSGGEFFLNGASVGDSVITLGTGDVLSGTLQDGSVFVFSPSLGDSLTGVHLAVTTVPTFEPLPILVDDDAGPSGLRPGQILIVEAGGVLVEGFSAAHGTLNVAGGIVGENAEMVATTINVSSGQVGRFLSLHQGSELNVTGGLIGLGATLFEGSSTVISGGEIEGSFSARAGSAVTITGGAIGNSFTAQSGSTVTATGGHFGRNFRVRAGSDVSFAGGDFKLNGSAIAPSTVSLGANDILTGVLEDGSAFLFSPLSGDAIDGLKLVGGTVPAVDPVPQIVDGGSGPRNLRAGETVIVRDGGQLADGFAAIGGILNIEGGSVGATFESTGAEINILGGQVGQSATFYVGSVVNISGGIVDRLATARAGSVINVLGGMLGNDFKVTEEAVLNVSGGTIGTNLTLGSGTTANISGGEGLHRMVAHAGSTVNITGGSVGETFEALSGSTVTVSGGQVGRSFRARSGSAINITGGEIEWDFTTFPASAVHVSGGYLKGINVQGEMRVDGGTIRELTVKSGGSVDMSEGRIELDVTVESGGTANITGGIFGFDFVVEGGGIANISAGRFGQFVANGGVANIRGGWLSGAVDLAKGSKTTLYGDDFRLNGVPYVGETISLATGDLFTGILEDGTPFMFTSERGSKLSQVKLAHAAVAPPQTEPRIIDADDAPPGMRGGETLVVVENGVLRSGFFGVGGALHVAGGTLGIVNGYSGGDVRLWNVELNISEGDMWLPIHALGDSQVTVTGGNFRWDLALSESDAHISGGTLPVRALGGSRVLIDGGVIDREEGLGLEVAADAEVTVMGGTIEAAAIAGTLMFESGTLNSVKVLSGGVVSISGGIAKKSFQADSGARADLLTGAFAWGFRADQGSQVRLFGGEFLLNGQTPLSSIVDLDPAVHDNAVLSGTFKDGTPFIFSSEHFDRLRGVELVDVALPPVDTTLITLSTDSALRGLRLGQTLTVVEGGALPDAFSSVGATLNVAGGSVGERLRVANSDVVVTGGSIGRGFQVHQVSTIRLSGGKVSPPDFWMSPDSQIHISGGEFLYNGQPAPDHIPTLMRGDVLTGTLEDGSIFVFDSASFGEKLHNISIHRTTVPELEMTPILLNDVGALTGLRPGQTLRLLAGGELPESFSAVRATLHIDGGVVGENADIVESTVDVRAGVIEGSINLFVGSELNISGGTVHYRVNARQGSVVNISGDANIEKLLLDSGAIANISGGLPRELNALPGTQINLFGTSFALGLGNPLPTELDFLEVGVPYVVPSQASYVRATLADGSYDRISLSNYLIYDGVAVTVTLTPLAGDYNGDQIVDAADYLVWRNTLGMTEVPRFTGADGNGDGEITVADYEVWKLHFGNSIGSASAGLASAVPEPASVVLWIMLAALYRARLRQSSVARRVIRL